MLTSSKCKTRLLVCCSFIIEPAIFQIFKHFSVLFKHLHTEKMINWVCLKDIVINKVYFIGEGKKTNKNVMLITNSGTLLESIFLTALLRLARQPQS